MPRFRSFDEDAVLDAAMACFWNRGYGATSVRDLGAATGLSAPSLYNAFGDKQALFARCLDRYLEGTMRARIARHAANPDPRAAIAAFMEDIVERSQADPRGCLLINTALEVAPHDVVVGTLVAERLVELEAFFLRCIRKGQRRGVMAPGAPAADLARLMLAAVIGLRVLARARPEPTLLRGAARQALAALDAG